MEGNGEGRTDVTWDGCIWVYWNWGDGKMLGG